MIKSNESNEADGFINEQEQAGQSKPRQPRRSKPFPDKERAAFLRKTISNALNEGHQQMSKVNKKVNNANKPAAANKPAKRLPKKVLDKMDVKARGEYYMHLWHHAMCESWTPKESGGSKS